VDKMNQAIKLLEFEVMRHDQLAAYNLRHNGDTVVIEHHKQVSEALQAGIDSLRREYRDRNNQI